MGSGPCATCQPTAESKERVATLASVKVAMGYVLAIIE